MDPLAERERWAGLEQTVLGASQGTRDLRVIGALMACQGCLVRRATGVTLAMWGSLGPLERMERRDQRGLQGPLARPESRAPVD